MTTMARTLQDKLASLEPARRAGIEAEAARLHTEYLTLQELRGGSLWVWLAADVLGNTSSRNHGAAAGCVTAGGSYSCSNK